MKLRVLQVPLNYHAHSVKAGTLTLLDCCLFATQFTV
jgi:hypothetical protein